jgi:hypothetical protein
MPIIFRKTAKGISEIETRAHRLPPRLRSTLILVNGKRDSADLKLLISQQGEETLQALVDQGFIEAVGETVHAAPPAAPPVAAAPAAAYAAATPDFVTLRRDAVRALNDALGPAAESLAIRMEKSHDETELRPLLTQAAKLVAGARGQAAAEAFAARFPSAAPPPGPAD